MSERVNFAERVRFANEIGRLKEENAELRKLVRGLEVCADEYADARTDCPLYDEGEPYRCAKERVMRELGIEADA